MLRYRPCREKYNDRISEIICKLQVLIKAHGSIILLKLCKIHLMHSELCFVLDYSHTKHLGSTSAQDR